MGLYVNLHLLCQKCNCVMLVLIGHEVDRISFSADSKTYTCMCCTVALRVDCNAVFSSTQHELRTVQLAHVSNFGIMFAVAGNKLGNATKAINA